MTSPSQLLRRLMNQNAAGCRSGKQWHGDSASLRPVRGVTLKETTYEKAHLENRGEFPAVEFSKPLFDLAKGQATDPILAPEAVYLL